MIMMEQNTKKKMSTKKKVLIIIAVIVGILVVCWGGYEIYANKVPEYNQNTTGMIYGNDKEDTLDEQQYNGFKKIVQKAIQQKCSDVDPSQYKDDGIAVAKSGNNSYEIAWGCEKQGQRYTTMVKVDMQKGTFIGGPKFKLDYFVSDFNNDATASNIEQGISDLGSLLGD